MKRYILGINLPLKSRCHESGVALLDMEGNVLFAVNEERLSRKKQDGDFPAMSIQAMLDYTGVRREQIAWVAVPTLTFVQKVGRFLEFLWRERRGRLLSYRTYQQIWRIIVREKNVKKLAKPQNQEQEEFTLKYYWRDFIKQNFPKARISCIDHHLAHAASAYFTSPWENTLIITVDGAGNLLTSTVSRGERGKITIIDKTFLPHSAGTFWGSITKTCGFRSGTRHGGKTTGLAARGNPDKLIGKMRQAIFCKGLRFHSRESLFFDELRLIPDWTSYEPERMKTFLGEASREDVAAAAQKRLEEILTQLVRNAGTKIPYDKIAVAGGVFANVLVKLYHGKVF